MKWKPKHDAIADAYIDDGINPKTGRRCKLHRCEECNDAFAKGDMRADHIYPIIPIEGFDSWDKCIERAFVEKDGFQALCKECHHKKTQYENKARREYKALHSQD
jgi:5-methylcytosine-specific restriction endonuclease McrA